MARTIVRRIGFGLAAVVGAVLLTIVAAAVTDRPTTEPLVLDRDAPEVTAFREAERAWFAHHGVEPAEHTVAVDGADLRVRVLEVGDGPPLLLLPGGPGDAGYFAPLLEDLAGHRVLLVNLPGGGLSDGVDSRAVSDRSLAIETLDAVYDHFELEAAPIAGGSRGGAWALWYGLERPERADAIAQLGVPPFVEGGSVPGWLRAFGVPGLNRLLLSGAALPNTPDEAIAGFEPFFGHPSATVEALPEQAAAFVHAQMRLPTYGLSWRSQVQAGLRWGGLGAWEPELVPTHDELSELHVPTMFVWPSNDPFGDPDLGREAADRLPDAHLEVSGVGHLPWLDDPAEVAGLLDGFLEDAGGRSGGAG